MKLTNEQLAKRVIKQVHALTPKLRDLEKDLRKLWAAFAHLPHGQKILGCRTKTEFCEKKLSRSMRTVQYLLNGRTQDKTDKPDTNNVRVKDAKVAEPLALPSHEETAAPAVEDDPEWLLPDYINSRDLRKFPFPKAETAKLPEQPLRFWLSDHVTRLALLRIPKEPAIDDKPTNMQLGFYVVQVYQELKALCEKELEAWDREQQKHQNFKPRQAEATAGK